MEESQEPAEIRTSTQGYHVHRPSEIPTAEEGESMDPTPGPSAEQATLESSASETNEEGLVLPRLSVRFQDEILSEVKIF